MLMTISFILGIDAQSVSYKSLEIECLNSERDGSQTLRVWGEGRNKNDAIEQAKKDAVYAVIFKGIRGGTEKGCNVHPIVFEVNAEKKYEYYFNTFFKDGGEYVNYVSMEDRRPGTTIKKKGNTQVKCCITVRVLRPELKQKLIEDKIIKP